MLVLLLGRGQNRVKDRKADKIDDRNNNRKADKPGYHAKEERSLELDESFKGVGAQLLHEGVHGEVLGGGILKDPASDEHEDRDQGHINGC